MADVEATMTLTKERRREEGRRKKRKLIEESGGVRPRQVVTSATDIDDGKTSKSTSKVQRKTDSPPKSAMGTHHRHRFGRVMESLPSRSQPRLSTLSIAIPGSIIANCQTKELRTQLAGQIARSATIYHVDEIIVFDDKLSRDWTNRQFRKRSWEVNQKNPEKSHDQQGDHRGNTRFDPHAFFARVLQYCETPQYLRRHFFPMHPDLQFAGLLAPVDAPHHVRADDCCRYREGVVLDKRCRSGGSLVNCGVPNRPVEIPTRLQAGIRCTVKLDPSSYRSSGQLKGELVSPSAPREDDGTYWGYSTRTADSIKTMLEDCPFEEGYDLKIGTSERGDSDIDNASFSLPEYRHAIIVFGGVAGIEECVDADECLRLPGSESSKLFDLWINVCKYQGSRTIRTEEAVLISLAKLSPLLMAPDTSDQTASKVGASDDAPAETGIGQHSIISEGARKKGQRHTDTCVSNERVAPVHFADNSVSEESSGED